MKDKIEPYCKFCQNEMCVCAECPACCDYCPVPNLPGVCRFEIRENMTPMKAWGNIADRLRIYAGEHGFTDEDMAAEVTAFRVLSAAVEVDDAAIDADAIYDKIEERYRNSSGLEHRCERDFLDFICDATTVDAFPVVRCRYCDNGSLYDDENVICFLLNKIFPGDGFCNYGKRRKYDED